MKRATRWRRDRARHLAEHRPAIAVGVIDVGNGVEEQPRIRVLGRREDPFGGAALDEDDQTRLGAERKGDHHALAHAARELMRIVTDARFRRGDSDLVQ